MFYLFTISVFNAQLLRKEKKKSVKNSLPRLVSVSINLITLGRPVHTCRYLARHRNSVHFFWGGDCMATDGGVHTLPLLSIWQNGSHSPLTQCYNFDGHNFGDGLDIGRVNKPELPCVNISKIVPNLVICHFISFCGSRPCNYNKYLNEVSLCEMCCIQIVLKAPNHCSLLFLLSLK